MIKKYMIPLVLSFSLSGCFNGTTPPSQFYTLTPTETKVISEKHLSIGIERIQLPRSLDRPQMLTASSETPEIKLSELNRWIEPLPTFFSIRSMAACKAFNLSADEPAAISSFFATASV